MIIATTGSVQGSKFNSCIASKILNFNQQIDPKCDAGTNTQKAMRAANMKNNRTSTFITFAMNLP
jgi:hypothetical protein